MGPDRAGVGKALAIPVIADADADVASRRGTLTIAWRPSRHELAVTYEAQRSTISRIVAAPARTEEGVEAAVALAVNLVLDQTSQILGPPPSADSAPPAPAVPAASAPPPSVPLGAPMHGRIPAPPPPPEAIEAAPAPGASPPPQQRFLIALVTGSGVGWASGNGDVTGKPAAPSGLAWARLVHVVPEVGYFVKPRLLIAAQARVQFVSGVSDLYPSASTMGCGSQTVCSGPRTAFAAFLKAALFAPRSASALRSYLSLAVGGGSIRYVVSNPSLPICGPDRIQTCVDSYSGGPLFLVPGAGVHVGLWEGLDLVAAAELALGVPSPTFNLDANVGLAYGF